jgi:hypothetical protein
MARIFPFQPYRYTEKAGPLGNAVTQPYDKISPAMRERYLALSPYNLVRVILGERRESDSETDNVYTRAAGYLNEWIQAGILARERTPSLYAYFQEFCVPDTGERLVRKSFIGLGGLEEYSAGVVHRHEQTLSGPKKDRWELLRHTRAHAGQLFMLYPDPAGEIGFVKVNRNRIRGRIILTSVFGGLVGLGAGLAVAEGGGSSPTAGAVGMLAAFPAGGYALGWLLDRKSLTLRVVP